MTHIAQLRRFFSAFLLAIMLAIGIMSTSGLPALAKTLTPEASAYEVDQDNKLSDNYEKLQEKVQSGKRVGQKDGSSAQLTDSAEDKNALGRAADNVREKLNLDEPVPQSTKDFLNSVKGK